jgi:uncharacterized protein
MVCLRTRVVRTTALRLVFLALCLTAAFGAAFSETVASMPAQPAGYVTDNANVLSDTRKTELEAYCRQVEQKANAQIFTAVVKTIDNEESVDQFANELFAKWRPGKKGSDRGILIVLSIQDHKYRIEVGYGLEGILNDAKVGDIGRDMVPFLKQAQYDNAVKTGITEVGSVIAADANVTIDTAVHQYRRVQQEPPPLSPLIRIGGIIFVLVILFLVFRRRGGGGPGGGGGGLGSFLTGMLIGNILGGGRRGGGDFGGGGGFGGGDDGGGFGGGGGGESGGGGAGGSW